MSDVLDIFYRVMCDILLFFSIVVHSFHQLYHNDKGKMRCRWRENKLPQRQKDRLENFSIWTEAMNKKGKFQRVLAIKIDGFNMSTGRRRRKKIFEYFIFFGRTIYRFRSSRRWRCVWYDRKLWDWIPWKMISWAYTPCVYQGRRHRNWCVCYFPKK